MKCEHAKDAADHSGGAGCDKEPSTELDCGNLFVKCAARESVIQSRGLCAQRMRRRLSAARASCAGACCGRGLRLAVSRVLRRPEQQ